MNYTLHQLQVFNKVVKNQSITKAAQELLLTQPAVSIQLKNFQEQFEIPLIEVIGKKVYVTDFGAEIAEAAEVILNEVYAINYKSALHKGQLAGRLKVSIVSTGKYVMPYFLTDFIHENESVELVMDVTNKQQVIESLEKNEVDFSLVSVLPKNITVDCELLLPNQLYLVGKPEKNVLKPKTGSEILESMPLLYREKGSATRQAMETFIEKNKVTSRKKIALTSNEAVKQAVIAGLGYSIMPLIGIKNELLNKQLEIIPMESLPITTNWYIIWLKNKKLSRVATAYLEYIRSHKNDIIKQHFNWFENF